ncbi:MAG: hypothetical protein ABEJ61_11650 [Haloferacaceae archaeon]
MRLPPTPSVDRDDAVVVQYSLGAEERPSEAIAAALAAAGIDLESRDTVLNDWIDGDAVDKLLEDTSTTHRLSTVIWDRPVEVTADTVTVYET